MDISHAKGNSEKKASADIKVRQQGDTPRGLQPSALGSTFYLKTQKDPCLRYTPQRLRSLDVPMTLAHRLRRRLAAPFASRPFLLQRLRWPNPFRPPYRHSELTLYRPGELGDVVMCLAVVNAIRRRNPSIRLTFVTNYHELLSGHPMIDRVLSIEAAQRNALRNMISLRYEVFVPLRLHVIDYLAGCVGLRNIDHRIPLPDFTSELGSLSPIIPAARPWIVVTRNAGPFTPNKDWPAARWDALIPRLAKKGTVIEVGTRSATASIAASHIDLRGRTNLRQFCGIISLADLVITPVTSTVHVAAAYDVPTLSVLGGYELPANTAYPRHTALYRQVPCSPCWLQSPCPIDRECLRQISVEEVDDAASAMLIESRAAARSLPRLPHP